MYRILTRRSNVLLIMVLVLSFLYAPVSSVTALAGDNELTITGQILDDRGTPMVGVSVSLALTDGSGTYSIDANTTSGADGTYTIGPRTIGFGDAGKEYRVRIPNPGVAGNESVQTGLVQSGRYSFNFTYVRYGISIIHIRDENNNPVPAGVPMWFSYVMPNDNSQWPWTAPADGITPHHVTDADGNITLDMLAAWYYDGTPGVDAGSLGGFDYGYAAGQKAYGGIDQTNKMTDLNSVSHTPELRYELPTVETLRDEMIDISSQAGKTVEYTFHVKPLGKVLATAQDSVTKAPVAGYDWNISTQSGFSKYSSTSGDGLSFSAYGYENDTATVSVSDPSNPEYDYLGHLAGSKTVTLAKWETQNVAIDLVPVTPGNIAGIVIDTSTDIGLAGATVELLWPTMEAYRFSLMGAESESKVLRTATTDSSGNFQFAGVVPTSGSQSYVVRVTKTGYTKNEYSGLSVASGEAVAMGELAIEPDLTPPYWYSYEALKAESLGRTAISLSWPIAQDDTAVTEYSLYQGSRLLANSGFNNANNKVNYKVEGLTADTDYSFAVTAADAMGNLSETPLSLSARTLPQYSPEAKVILVTSDSAGIQANDDSEKPAVSDDGRYVAYSSDADNLVAGDANYCSDIFLFDRTTGQTICVSRAPGGLPANGESSQPAISADGRYVAFSSYASDLVSQDSPNTSDVFLYDRILNTTELISCTPAGAFANSRSEWPSISSDGRYVAFSSETSNLVVDDTNGTTDIFIRDRLEETTVRVSKTLSGAQLTYNSYQPALSGNGEFVAYQVTGASYYTSIYLYDVANKTTILVSRQYGDPSWALRGFDAALSDDGRFVSFNSTESGLVEADTNGKQDVFLFDCVNGSNELISVASDGTQGNNYSTYASVSADGRYVAFKSAASNLVAGDTNGGYDIFVRDRTLGTTERVSVSADGIEGNGESSWLEFAPVITADGRYLVFDTYASNLVAADTNAAADLILIDRGAPTEVNGLPSQITEFTLYPQNGTVYLRWNLPEDEGDFPVTGFILQRAESDSGPYTEIAQPLLPSATGACVEYIDSTCVAGTATWYRVAAVSSIGTGTYSIPLGVRSGQPWILHDYGPVAGLSFATTISRIEKVPSSNILYGTGNACLYQSTDAGYSWTVINSSLPGDTTQNIHVLSEQQIVLTGKIAQSKAMYLSTDGGVNFVQMPIELYIADGGVRAEYFIDVAFNGSVGVAVGSGGYIARTTDSGATWALVRKPALDLDDAALTRVEWAAGSNTVYATGFEGTILKSTNGGVSWTLVAPSDLPLDMGIQVELRDLAVLGANEVWVVGGAATVIHTMDGGVSWGKVSFPLRPEFNGAGYQEYPKLIAFQTNQIGYLSLSSDILRTEDAGEHWLRMDQSWNSRTNPPAFLDLTLLDSGRAMISALNDTILVLGASSPSAPGNFQAVAGDACVDLTWTQAVGFGVTGYRIERAEEAAGSYSILATTAAGVLSYRDAAAVNETEYFYRVSAVNPIGEGTTGCISATPSLAQASAPSKINAFTLYPENGLVTLRWNKPANDGGSLVAGYILQRAEAYDGPFQTLAELGLPLDSNNYSSYTDLSCAAGVNYWYRVAAVNGAGTGEFSMPLGARTGQPWVSHDYGPVDGLSFATTISMLEKIPNSNILYGTGNACLYQSTDAGYSWTVINSSLPGDTTQNIHVINEQCIILTGKIAQGKAMYLSTDGGLSFVQMPIELYIADGGVRAEYFIDIDFNGSVGVAVGSGGYIARTMDSGATWALVRKPALDNDDAALIRVEWAEDTNTVYAVGFEGTLLKSTDNGVSWTSAAPPDIPIVNDFKAELKDIAVISPNEAWVVGTGGTILHTTDGGTTWQYASFPRSPEYAGIDNAVWPTQIAFADAAVGYLAMDNGILKTVDNGDHWLRMDQSWSSRTNPPAFLDLALLDSGRAVISALNDTVLVLGASAPPVPTNLTASGGDRRVNLSWSAAQGFGVTGYRIERAEAAAGIYSVIFTTAADAVSYQDTSVVNESTYDYRVTAINPIGAGPAASVSAKPSLHVATAPDPITEFILYPQNGVVTLQWNAPEADGGSPVTGYALQRATSYDGTYTTLAEPALPANLAATIEYTDNTCLSGNTYWYRIGAINIIGTKYSTPLGVKIGEAWELHDYGPVMSFETTISIVKKVPGSDILYGTGNRCLFRSADGGSTWTAVNTLLPGTTTQSIYPLTGEILILTGGISFGSVTANLPDKAIYRSTDGGVSFTKMPIDLTQLEGSTGLEYFMDLDFFGNTGVAVGTAGYIARTMDAGLSWTLVRKPSTGENMALTKVIWAGPTTLYAIGFEGVILKSVNSGATWSFVSPTGLPLNIGGKIIQMKDIDCISPDNVWAVGNEGVILHTSDGGLNWQHIYFPEQPAYNGQSSPVWPTHVSFTDNQTGYIILSSDIIKTEDGGQHWYSMDKTWSSRTNAPSIQTLTFLPSGRGVATAMNETVLTFLPPQVAIDEDTVIANQKEDSGISINTSIGSNNQPVTQITLDEEAVLDGINPNGQASLTIETTDAADRIQLDLSSSLLGALSSQCDMLDLQTSLGDYKIPFDELKPFELLGNPGDIRQDKLEKAVVRISISKPDQAELDAAEQAARAAGLAMMTIPVKFELQVTVNGISTSVTRFGSYVTKVIYLQPTTDTRNAVGVEILADGTMVPVPTTFEFGGGALQANLRRNSNSIYTVIRNDAVYEGPTDHWAWADYSLLATKLVIKDAAKIPFYPEKTVTRLEFVQLITRALGLASYPDGAAFTDLPQDAEILGAVGAAVDAGILSGYPDGSFRPEAELTREQAAAILVRALRYAGTVPLLNSVETAWQLSRFTDRNAVAGWAAESVAAAVRVEIISGDTDGRFAPHRYCTTAEAVAMVHRMMTAGGLISE